MTTLDLATKVSSLVTMIRCGKNTIFDINCQLYLFEIDMVPLGDIVWTTFDPVTTMGCQTWMCRYGAALTVYDAIFMPSIKSQQKLRYLILPCYPTVCVPGKILPGC